MTTSGISSAQDSFNIQLSLDLEHSKTAAELETEINTLKFSFYLKPVQISNVPYGVAAFVDVHSVFHVAKTQSDKEDQLGDVETDTFSFAYKHIKEGNPLFFGIGLSKADIGGQSNFGSLIGDVDSKRIGIGYYFDKYTMIELNYNKSNGEVEHGSAAISLDSSGYELSYLMLSQINNTHFIQLDLQVSLNEENGANETILDTIARFHFNKSTAVGAEFISVSSDDTDDEGNLIGITASLFPNPFVGLGITYGEFSAKENSANNENFVRFVIDGRF